jgi:hypothetical protein
MALQALCWAPASSSVPWSFLHTRYDSLDEWSAGRKTATYTQDNTNRINAHTNFHALSGIRTHNLSVRVSEDSSYLRPRGHCDRQPKPSQSVFLIHSWHHFSSLPRYPTFSLFLRILNHSCYMPHRFYHRLKHLKPSGSTCATCFNIRSLHSAHRLYLCVLYSSHIAGHGSRAVEGMNCLRSLGSWDRMFESHTRHGCLVCVCVYSVFVLSCV